MGWDRLSRLVRGPCRVVGERGGPVPGSVPPSWYWRGAGYLLVRTRSRGRARRQVNPGIHLALSRWIPGITWLPPGAYALWPVTPAPLPRSLDGTLGWPDRWDI